MGLAVIYSELSTVLYCLTKNLIYIYSFPSREFIIFLVPLLPFQVVVFGTFGVNLFVFISMLSFIPILAGYFAIIPCSLLQYCFSLNSIIWCINQFSCYLNKFNWFISFYFYFINIIVIFYSDLYLLSWNRQSLWYICCHTTLSSLGQ